MVTGHLPPHSLLFNVFLLILRFNIHITGKANEVEQGLKELNNEVKELDKLEDPPEDKKEVHKKLVALVTGFRDIVQQALKGYDNGDTETLMKLNKELNEINKSAKEIAEEVRK